MTKEKIGLQIATFILKIVLVIVLIALAFIIGAMIGYGVLGDGNPFAIFEKEIWVHIFSYFTKPTIVN
ncbi:DNA-directed RNA polymerase subunit beta [Carnobacterium viridans]|uniref:DNA-directed RNA polymerase subunit beta n=1 Tax=Carnobacterium viridans TaxID=174587 RepID=A0A1H0YNF8_9LACT|nr:DNA-directed RNA polymerase subunit beta [Carnobacterium viridans]UDE95035.1 DNA-directed RNA polymerase subunit beta [Carnobacterium viridans]SDQ16659.1 DNA-directed RNA polymerase subunit beta [Carnobacterium viridans]